MTQRWEYMAIDWIYETEEELQKRSWRREFQIYRPGEKVEVRQGWHSDDPKTSKTTLLDLLNELGAEGWEMISESVIDSTVLVTLRGFNQVGTPVTTRYLLKRAVVA